MTCTMSHLVPTDQPDASRPLRRGMVAGEAPRCIGDGAMTSALHIFAAESTLGATATMGMFLCPGFGRDFYAVSGWGPIARIFVA